MNECLVANFVLEYDNTTKTSHPPDGVETRVTYDNYGLDAVEYYEGSLAVRPNETVEERLAALRAAMEDAEREEVFGY